MACTVRQLAELVQGKVIGDGDLLIQAARSLQDARPGDITFAETEFYADKLQRSQAVAAVVPPKLRVIGKTLIEVADPLMSFVFIVQHLQGKTQHQPTGIDARAIVHASARVGAEPSIDPFASVGENTLIGARCRLFQNVFIGKNCRIGNDVVLYPNVVIYDDTVIGDRVAINANSVIGADGFGYRFQQGRHVKVPQLGNVIIGNDVEIGANTAIDRGTFGPTTIGDGTKIDNLVQIAHNCIIGKHNALAAQVGIAGSSSTGNYVFMGGQAGISDHVHVSDGAMFGAKTGVFQDVPAGQRMFLNPAQEHRQAARVVVCLKKLPEMRKDLLRILKELNLTSVSDAPSIPLPEAPAA